MRKILIVLFLISSLSSFAQRGNLLVKNYHLASSPQITEVVQNSKGIVYYAHSTGILSYDGFRWDNILLDVSPRSLAIDSQDVLYVGGKGFLGQIVTDISGKPHFKNLSEKQQEIGDITHIAITSTEVLFYSSKAIYSYKDNQTKVIFQQEKDELLGWVVHQNTMFLNTPDKGLCKWQNGALLPIKADILGKDILSFIPFSAKETLFATNDNLLWILDGQYVRPFLTFAISYLNDNFLEKLAVISDTDFAIATLAGGVLVVNKKDGSIRHIINYETGLADNEISAILTDKQQGLWICHAEGISRVALHLPIYSYSHYPGLEGKPTTILKVKDLLYVATNAGVFYLSSTNKDDVSGKVAYEKQRQLQQIAWQKAQQRRKKNFLQKINPFTLKKDAEKPAKVVAVVVESNVYNYNYSNYIIERIPYNFRKIAEIDAKCKRLVPFQDRVVALTNTGLYEIQFGIASTILEDRNLLHVEVSKKNPTMLYITTQKGVFTIQKTSEGWGTPQYIADIQGVAFNTIQYHDYLWVTGEGKVWKVELNQGVPARVKSYVLEKNSNTKILARVLKDELFFFTSKGVLKYAESIGDLFLPEPDFVKYNLQTQKFFINQEEYTWVNQGGYWEELNGKILKTSSFLPVFSEVQDVYQDAQNNLWIATTSGLYRINAQQDDKNLATPPSTFVKQVQIGNGNLLSLEKPSIASDGNIQNFTLQIAFPFFVAEENTQFQYYLKGLDGAEWSAWRNQPWVEFPYLPSGNYTLQFRSKNALGQVSATQAFTFEVKAPFWQTWWFYLLQIGVLFGLLLAAVIYNRRGAESKIASVITLVAIITVFELLFLLIEPLIDNFSGGVFVFKLFVNILLAVSLVPMERKIQRYLQNSEYLDALARKIGWRKRLKDIGDYLNAQQIREIARNRRQSE
jgi:ligand-binding sensor domain-containing protein